MAWRPYENLIEGMLDNRTPGQVTGWMRFVGMKERVTFDLKGDFHRDIRGTVIRLKNPEPCDRSRSTTSYMESFATHHPANKNATRAAITRAPLVAAGKNAGPKTGAVSLPEK